MTRVVQARPVLKWAGGKTQILDQILARLPDRIDTFFEPFVGGAAVFFALAAAGRFRRAVIADKNPDLLAVYRALQADAEGVVRALSGMKHSESEFYRIRALAPRGLVQRAARVIYLNKTGYNGLYRVNRSGQFNVPFGRHKNPTLCDAENLRAAAQVLADVEILEADFEDVCRRARPGDAVYLDPPYVPLSKTANFTAYARHPFGMDEHERLARAFADLERRRVDAVLSNSDTPETRALYRGFRASRVKVARNINSRGTARGPINELLVVAERVTRPRSRAS
ncbi:MAG: DNA adenine methylase [Polyangiaceae bacterium]|nr:DNA adenine methylase [Myxococcales bacterium]MCC6899596.1 DNA adenine methylase [Polyangiaceae bacterium]